MLNAVEHTNFFENRATEYSKASTTGTWEEAFARPDACRGDGVAGRLRRICPKLATISCSQDRALSDRRKFRHNLKAEETKPSPNSAMLSK